MEFVTDSSVEGVLVLAGVILLLFAVYLFMVFLSNRSLKKISQRTHLLATRKKKSQEETHAHDS